MRVADGAHAGSRFSLQTRQVEPTAAGEDDWKAGVYEADGVASLAVFHPVDAWEGPPEPDRTPDAAPAGIKIGGSYQQDTAERNPFTGRFDDLMFFDRVLTADEVRRQY